MNSGLGIGINGLGRIGRLVLRRLLEQGEGTGVYPAAINSSYPAETIAHMLRYDSIHGRLKVSIEIEDEQLVVNGRNIQLSAERDPERIPWRGMNVATVIEATGKFNNAEGSGKHLLAGASHVVITAPAKDADVTIVKGVNDGDFDASRHRLISTASCTTNCVAPVLHTLDRAFGIKGGWVTTVHAYTNDQRHLDNPHKDLRRARSCTQSIVPTTTGIGEALRNVLPHLSTSIRGLSLRVPVPDVSTADMTITLCRAVSSAELRDVFFQAERRDSNILGMIEEPLVSVDFIGDQRSAVIDGLSLVAHGDQVKILAWYDNEWAYSCRVLDMVEAIALSLKTPVKAG